MLRCWCVLVVGALWPGVAGAQAITFDEALSLTEASPEQRARERELQARARGDAEISEIITSPLRIDAQPGVRMLVQESSGFEGQLTVQQAWSLADLGGARRRTARHERDALAAQARAVALEARLGAAHAWLALRATEEALELARAEAALAHELAERAERSAGAGVLTAADAADAAAFAAEAELRALAIEGTAVQARVALARETAREASHDLRTEGEAPVPELPAPEMIEARLADAERHPSVVAARLATIALRAREVEAAAEVGPELTTGVVLYRESPGQFLLFGELGVTLPLADLAARQRSQILAEAERIEGDEERARLAVRALAVEVAHEVEHARREEALVTDTVLPSLERLVSAREAMLAAGEGTTLALLDARRRLVAARARAAEVRAGRTWAELRAWLLLAELARASAEEGS